MDLEGNEDVDPVEPEPDEFEASVSVEEVLKVEEWTGCKMDKLDGEGEMVMVKERNRILRMEMDDKKVDRAKLDSTDL
jgi:hypothetical protein